MKHGVASCLPRVVCGALFIAASLASRAYAVSGWFDDSCRRAIEIPMEAAKAGAEVCLVEFYTGGHLNPDGSDLRVATDEGRQVPAQIMRVGPGDCASIAFNPVRGGRRYYAFFGNPNPPANRLGFDELKTGAGLQLEMHQWSGGAVDNFRQIEQAWRKAGPLIGRTMIDSPFYGINPFGPRERTISKLAGTLTAPAEGEYNFAVYAHDRGALYLDASPVVFATAGPADVRHQAKANLKKGPHTFLFYHMNAGSDGSFTVAWMKPRERKWEVIPSTALGAVAHGVCGPLEEIHKTLTADFTITYGGECFYEAAYSHRYRFSAHQSKAILRATYEWDFGDGQTGVGLQIDHVYLADGVYPVKMTLRIGANRDTMTNRVAISRDWEHINNPPADLALVQSKIVGQYNVAKMPDGWLPRAAWLHQRAGHIEWMLAVATRMASLDKHPDPDEAFAALQGAAKEATDKKQPAAAVTLWDATPADSDLQPHAAAAEARLLLWRTGDFARAAQVLRPFATSDDSLRRLYADSLVLNQKTLAGRKILESLPVREPPDRQAAKSGALARTIEYYINEKDADSGEAQWESWQDQFPADFLEGYSVLLQTKLMEVQGTSEAAAKLAKAFATAIPESSYAPELLFRAAKLLEQTDPMSSQALIKLLKDRYPEDPLAQ